MEYYEPPTDVAGTVFDPSDDRFGPIMAAIQAGEFEQAAKLLAPDTLDPKIDNVYLVVKSMSDDGIYVFAKEEDRDEFFDACGGDEDDVFDEIQKTDEPIIIGKTATDIIAAQKGDE